MKIIFVFIVLSLSFSIATFSKHVTAQQDLKNINLDNFTLSYTTVFNGFIDVYKKYDYNSNTKNLTLTSYTVPSTTHELQSMIISDEVEKLIKETVIRNNLLAIDFMSLPSGYSGGTISYNVTITDANNDKHKLVWYNNSQKDLSSIENNAKDFESLLLIN